MSRSHPDRFQRRFGHRRTRRSYRRMLANALMRWLVGKGRMAKQRGRRAA